MEKPIKKKKATYEQKKKNIDKIASVIVKNPNLSRREIAEEIGVSKRTVERYESQAVEKAGKDHRIQALLDIDHNILMKGRQILEFRLSDPETRDKISARDINEISKTSASLIQIFGGDITDSSGGLRQPIATGTIDPVQLARDILLEINA